MVEPLKQGADLWRLIPQDDPFILIDQLLDQTKEHTLTRFTPSMDHFFTEGGKFNSEGMVENIAQTAAARVGYMSWEDNGKGEAPEGFIAGIKGLKVHFLPFAEQPIETEIILVKEIMNICLIKGKVFQNDDLAAECELKVFLGPAGEEEG